MLSLKMMKVLLQDIIHFMQQWAPEESALTWDNVGLQLGDKKAEVLNVLCALEIDNFVLDFLNKQSRFDLILTHHPLFFKPLSYIDYGSDMAAILRYCFLNETAVYAAHTNLDKAKNGVNACLYKRFGFFESSKIDIDNGFGAYFETSHCLDELKAVMPCRLLGAQDTKKVKRVGFACGSGHGLVRYLPNLNIDTLITGEITYHDHVFCAFHGIRVIAVGHYASEVLIVSEMVKMLSDQFSGLTVKEAPQWPTNPEINVYF